MGRVRTVKRALLLSGGMDSLALAYWKRPRYAITINYGQIAFEGELRASRHACKFLDIEHIVISANCSAVGSGIMAQKPRLKGSASNEWWPYRNQMLVTLGAMHAITIGANELLLGIVRSDSIYGDGSARFCNAIDRLVSMQEGGVRVSAPALKYSTVELIEKSGIPLDLLVTGHSCNLSALACGQCRSCLKHRQSMFELGYPAF